MDMINNNYTSFAKIILITLSTPWESVYVSDVNAEFANATIFKNVNIYNLE